MRIATSRRCFVAAVAAGLLALSPAGAVDDLDSLISELGSESWRERNAATLELSERRDLAPLEALEAVLRERELSPEQRLRLLQVAHERFRTAPRAAMGIQMSRDEVAGSGVVLELVRPEFPASEVLRAGDAIIAADGVVLRDSDDLRAIIIAHDPGDAIPVRVVRDGEEMEAIVRLGAFSDLENGRVDDSVIAAAWEVRSAPLRTPEATPLDSGLVPNEHWKLPPRGARARAWSRSRGNVVRDLPDLAGPPRAVAAGEPRGGVEFEEIGPRKAAREIPLNIRRLQPRIEQGRDVLRAQLDIRKSQRELVREEVAQLERMLEAEANPQERRKLSVRIEEGRRLIEQLDSEIRAGEDQLTRSDR